VGGSLALLSGPHFSCELLSATRSATLTLTAEAEVLKLHEILLQVLFSLKRYLQGSQRKSTLSIEELSSPLAVDTSATTR
jgi:hypothetical protein